MSKANKKKVTVAVLCAALVTTIVAGGSLAYLTDSASRTNKINVTTDLDVDIDEGDWPDPDDEPDLLPGDIYEKKPTVTTDNNVYYRFKVTYIDQADDSIITDADRIALIEKAIKYDPDHAALPVDCTYTEAEVEAAALATFNETNYIKVAADDAANDGYNYYFYYKDAEDYIFATTDEGAPLFTTLVFPSDWSNNAVHSEIITLGKFDIKLDAEAIQADNNPCDDDDDNAFIAWFNDNYTAPAQP